MFLCAIPFLGLWGIAGPSVQSLMSRRVDPTSQGKLQGAINSVRAITGMIGPLLFTQVLAIAIAPRAPVHFPGAPYFLATLLLVSSLLLAAYVTRPTAAVQPSVQAAQTSILWVEEIGFPRWTLRRDGPRPDILYRKSS